MSRQVKCGDCGWVGPEEDTDYVEDMADRTDAGPIYGEVPAGQCPNIIHVDGSIIEPGEEVDEEDKQTCGALCYLDDPESNAARKLHKAAPKLLAALEQVKELDLPPLVADAVREAIKEAR